MDCNSCREGLYSFLDGEMKEGADFLQGHLDECIPCFSRSEIERAFGKAVRARTAGVPMPDGFEARLRRELDSEDTKKGRQPPDSRPPVPRMMSWLVAAGIVVAGGFLAPRLLSSHPTVPGAIANPVQVSGHLICLTCACAKDAPAPGLERQLFSPGPASAPHGRLALRDDAGEVWALAGDGADALQLEDHARAGDSATVFGIARADLHAIRVARLTID